MKIDLDTVLAQEQESQIAAAEAVLSEYLGNLSKIDSVKHDKLVEKLKNDSFKKNFRTAIMLMSVFMSAAMILDDDDDFIDIKNKVLFEAKNDTEEMKEMRDFYMDAITPDQLTNILETEDDVKIFVSRVTGFRNDYKEVIG